MRSPRLMRTVLTLLAVIAVPAALAVPAAAAAPAVARGAGQCSGKARPPTAQPAPVGASSTLAGIGVVTPCNVWAVGSAGTSPAIRTLVEHWTGKAWTRVASPNPPGVNAQLTAVTVVSSTSIWAAGSVSSAAFEGTLIEHWNGMKWQVVASPSPAGASAASVLNGIWAASAKDVWAVGFAQLHGVAHALIEHWDGKNWTAITKPSQGATTDGTFLSAVGAGGGSAIWAVGNFCPTGAACQPTSYRLSGKKWLHVGGPAIPGSDSAFVLGMSAVSRTDVWAVGTLETPTAELDLVEHWNGKAWSRVTIAEPAGMNDFLNAVVAGPGRVLAVGGSEHAGKTSTLILSSNGKTWTRTRSRDPLGSKLNYEINAISGSSCSTAWLAGDAFATGSAITGNAPAISPALRPIALHC